MANPQRQSPPPPPPSTEPAGAAPAPASAAPPEPSAAVVTMPRAQLDELLDGMLELQEQVAALKSAQTGQAAVVVEQSDKTAEFDAELEQLKKEFSDYPAIDIFERRALVGLDANLDIRLKGDVPVTVDPSGEACYWKLRWFNFGKEGRAQQFDAEGYLKVEITELENEEVVSGLSRVDKYVRRGDRGLEVLGKMPRKLWNYKKRRDAARHGGLLTSETALKDHQANQVAAMVGARGGNADQAGSFVKGLSVTITQGKTERFTP